VNESAEKVERPTSITIICVIGFFGALVSLPIVFSPLAQQVGSWYPPYLGFASIVGLACMIGLWRMKKWAPYTYTSLVALNQIVLLAMGVWNILALVLPAIVAFFALKHVSKMSS
jgi:hypothetical protein